MKNQHESEVNEKYYDAELKLFTYYFLRKKR